MLTNLPVNLLDLLSKFTEFSRFYKSSNRKIDMTSTRLYRIFIEDCNFCLVSGVFALRNCCDTQRIANFQVEI